ncbi:transmembrane protein adipocyte-associated [Anaeramoeba flamelloides]|uniref:Transmembrane protein adipocyte-associated n=1 Tax=Anaeramoeba flamelloides TaxID=1746091 RepID=A0AAV7YAD0_9EUKA|nr:transmembrane protein adipocyte-associated [Anaeramoeba flamelloides]
MILLNSSNYQLSFCKDLITNTGSVRIYALLPCLFNLLFLSYLITRFRRHRQILRSSNEISVSYLYSLIYIVSIVSFGNVILEAFGLLKNQETNATIVFLLTHLCSFFCEYSILVSIIVRKQAHFFRRSITFTTALILLVFALEIILNWGFDIKIFAYEKSQQATIFWFCFDGSFVATYFLVLVVSSLPKYSIKFPLKEQFYQYIFLIFSTKLAFLTANIFIYFQTQAGYW